MNLLRYVDRLAQRAVMVIRTRPQPVASNPCRTTTCCGLVPSWLRDVVSNYITVVPSVSTGSRESAGRRPLAKVCTPAPSERRCFRTLDRPTCGSIEGQSCGLAPLSTGAPAVVSFRKKAHGIGPPLRRQRDSPELFLWSGKTGLIGRVSLNSAWNRVTMTGIAEAAPSATVSRQAISSPRPFDRG